MQSPDCLNCGGAITVSQKFCPKCGQQTGLPRLTMRQLSRDFLQKLLHAEQGLLKLFRGLLLRPGPTAVEYVEGKRKTYFNPFGFLAICITLMVLYNKWIKPYGDLPVPDPDILANMPDEEYKRLYTLSVDRIARVQDFANRNLNLISVLVTPYFSFSLWLFYRNRNRNMAEITVAYLLYTGFTNVVSSLLFSPLLAMVRNTPMYYYLFCTSLLLQTFYFAWGFKVFFGYRTTRNYFKVLLVLWLIGFIGLILLIASYFIYAYHGAYNIFPYLSK
jgi:hypothetical protein